MYIINTDGKFSPCLLLFKNLLNGSFHTFLPLQMSELTAHMSLIQLLSVLQRCVLNSILLLNLIYFHSSQAVQQLCLDRTSAKSLAIK